MPTVYGFNSTGLSDDSFWKSSRKVNAAVHARLV